MSTFICKRCNKEQPSTIYNKSKGICNFCVGEKQAEELTSEGEALAAFAKENGNTVILPQEEATKELASRELARRRLLHFIERFSPLYKAGWVHKDICQKLEKFSEDVAAGLSPRLMLFVPPRHGKSEIASRNFPAWHFGKYPWHEIMAISYGSPLALKFSRKVRALLQDPAYEMIFPGVALKQDSQSVEYWETTAGGSYMAAGISGPLTGNGCHIGIIDDPVKNREEAESQTIRDGQKEWYTSTFYTRLAPGAGILIILTRWHHDDLAGWLLEEAKNGGDQWDVIVYPAIAERDETYRRKGEALHPERYPLEALQRIRRAVGPRDWQALYQQQPTSDAGDFFIKNQIRTYAADEFPKREELLFYTAWDLAIGQKQANDFSVGVTGGMDRDGRLWVADLVRDRMDGLKIVDTMLDTHVAWGTKGVGVEHGQISMSIGPLLNRRIAERKVWDFPWDPTVGGLKAGRSDKQSRARAIQGRIRQGLVLFPRDALWWPALLSELLAFPNGAHDDQVDALAWLGLMLDTMTGPAPVPEPKKPSWRDKINGAGSPKSFSAMGA